MAVLAAICLLVLVTTCVGQQNTSEVRSDGVFVNESNIKCAPEHKHRYKYLKKTEKFK